MTTPCERCGAPTPTDPLRAEATALGIDLGPVLCEPCFDTEQAAYFAEVRALEGKDER